MGLTLKILISVPFGVAISTIHFWKADILGLLKNTVGRVSVVAYRIYSHISV